jgi:hypothetical protein
MTPEEQLLKTSLMRYSAKRSMGVIYSIILMILAGVGAYLALTITDFGDLATPDSWLVQTFGLKNLPYVLAGAAGVVFLLGLLWFLMTMRSLTTGYRAYEAHVKDQIAAQTGQPSVMGRMLYGVGVREQPSRLKGIAYLLLTVILSVGLVIAWDMLGDYYITLKFMDTPLMGARLFMGLGAAACFILGVGELRGNTTTEHPSDQTDA